MCYKKLSLSLCYMWRSENFEILFFHLKRSDFSDHRHITTCGNRERTAAGGG